MALRLNNIGDDLDACFLSTLHSLLLFRVGSRLVHAGTVSKGDADRASTAHIHMLHIRRDANIKVRSHTWTEHAVKVLFLHDYLLLWHSTANRIVIWFQAGEGKRGPTRRPYDRSDLPYLHLYCSS